MKYLKVYEDYIFEGKKEFLQGKYKLEPDLFNKLIDADPTNGKYFEWIITRYIKSKDKKVYLEDLYKIKEYLTTFDVLKKQYKIKETDIGKYLDYKDLFLKISEIGELVMKVKMKLILLMIDYLLITVMLIYFMKMINI
jgi:hypothetical protein